MWQSDTAVCCNDVNWIPKVDIMPILCRCLKITTTVKRPLIDKRRNWNCPFKCRPRTYTQESFWLWAQPMRDGVTLQCRRSMAEPIPRIIRDTGSEIIAICHIISRCPAISRYGPHYKIMCVFFRLSLYIDNFKRMFAYLTNFLKMADEKLKNMFAGSDRYSRKPATLY